MDRLMRRALSLAFCVSCSAACGDVDSFSALSASDGFDLAVPAQGDEPSAVVANPFVTAADDPLSTFGADVDTASYDYFRQSVTLYNDLPEPSEVRIEDFVNYFPYDYPQPESSAQQPFDIALAAAPHPLGRTTTLLRVGIQAKPAPEDKKPANLVFLVDTSGSMDSRDKLPLVKVVLSELLAELEPSDTVSIVTYSQDTGVKLEPTPVRDREAIDRVIRGLSAGGGTWGEGGLNLAYEQAKAGFIQDGINHVVLCTDGDFNLGVSSNEELLKLIRKKRDSGVTLTALGFGHDNLNDSMMEAVSNAGNGIYSLIIDPEGAVEYAHERLLATLIHVAKDMKIQVELNPAHVLAYRLLGYEDRAIPDDSFRDDHVDGGEVGAGHRVTALYELVLKGEKVPTPKSAPALSSGDGDTVSQSLPEDELVRVRVRYKQPTESDADAAGEVSEALAPAAIAAQSDDSDLAWAAAVASFAEVLRESPYASRAELVAVARIVEAQRERDRQRGELATLFEAARHLMGP